MAPFRRARFLLAVAAATLPTTGFAQPAEEPRFGGEIEVSLVITEVRVVDSFGHPAAGLAPEDFAVRINGEQVRVVDADWIPPPATASKQAIGGAEAWAAAEDRRDDPAPRLPGRLIVIVFQTDFNSVRLTGLYRMSHYAAQFVESLAPADRVALVVYGSHLQLHSDFTNDLRGLRERLTVPDLVAWRHEDTSGTFPSLAAGFDVQAARDAATFSQGLRVLGEALQHLPGPKSVVLFAWGIGRYTSSHTVWLGRDFIDAKHALTRARATVFSLDVTDADSHTLEVGLQAVSRGTGGFYAKTHLFPESAVTRLANVISGHYELALEPPPGLGEYFAVSVDVDLPDTQVFVRPIQTAEPTPN